MGFAEGFKSPPQCGNEPQRLGKAAAVPSSGSWSHEPTGWAYGLNVWRYRKTGASNQQQA